MSDPDLSVIVCTHNPRPASLARVRDGLRSQNLPAARWELLLIDNASADPAAVSAPDWSWHPRARIVREETLGLTAARLRGFAEARGGVFVLVDDDNVLAADYLQAVADAFAGDAALGAAGGRSVPEFESPPPPWVRSFDGMLALRERAPDVPRANWRATGPREYPACAPVGAGMAVRRDAAEAYATGVRADPRRRALDRAGRSLVSGGDNDLVMTVLETGLDVAYLPGLVLTHLIPAARTDTTYLGGLNRATMRSWLRVLALHGIRTWPPVPRGTVALRQFRAWWRSRAWQGDAAWVRWQGQCGQFEGQADLADP